MDESDKRGVDPVWAEKVARIRKASGSVNSDDPLVILLYTLARDEIPSGVIDNIIDKQIRGEASFSNGWLALWAKDAALRLEKPKRCEEDNTPKYRIPITFNKPRWWEFRKKNEYGIAKIIYEYGINEDGSPKGAIPLEKFGWG